MLFERITFPRSIEYNTVLSSPFDSGWPLKDETHAIPWTVQWSGRGSSMFCFIERYTDTQDRSNVTDLLVKVRSYVFEIIFSCGAGEQSRNQEEIKTEGGILLVF